MADLVELLNRQAAGIGRRFQHQRRNGGDQRGLGHPFRAVAADIAGYFAAACGEADQDGVFQVERFDELREVVGIGVHVVAIPGLARPAVAATVMGDAAIAVGGQKQHLSLPAIRTEGPAVAEHHRLSCAPVLVIDLRTVFRRDRAHCLAPSLSLGSGSVADEGGYVIAVPFTLAKGVSACIWHRVWLIISSTRRPCTSKASAINERWQRHGTASAHIIATHSCFASFIKDARFCANSALCI